MATWKRIEGHSNYWIHQSGKVYSSKGKIFLSFHNTSKGYKRTSLNDRGVETKKMLHVLIATAFIPNPQNKLTVNHKDGVKNNNSISNLEWNTFSENNQHAWDTGLRNKK